jgi:hypothetical protein
VTWREDGELHYGDEQADLRVEIAGYSRAHGYPATHFADATCACGARVFHLALDEDEGVAVRMCTRCAATHPIGDSAGFLDDAHLEACACPCGAEAFEITVGVALKRDSEDVRRVYLGARCAACGCVGVYGDWENEDSTFRALLARV